MPHSSRLYDVVRLLQTQHSVSPGTVTTYAQAAQMLGWDQRCAEKWLLFASDAGFVRRTVLGRRKAGYYWERSCRSLPDCVFDSEVV